MFQVNERIRISRFLAMCGISSRRNCEELVLAGKIKINGKVIKDLFYKVGAQDTVEYESQKIYLEKKTVIALNKPPGYLSTVRDDFQRKTVLDLIGRREHPDRLYPVGRLDYNSRGLIILTNDGDLSYMLTHPKFGIPKVYRVRVKGIISPADISNILSGVKIEGKDLIASKVNLLKKNRDNCLIEIMINEGRKRIIRKVLANLGYQVIDLQRTAIGKFEVKDIREGTYRIMMPEDIEKLQQSY